MTSKAVLLWVQVAGFGYLTNNIMKGFLDSMLSVEKGDTQDFTPAIISRYM